MQITRQADYAVRAVSFLARLSPGERVPTSLIAERQRIPQTFLAKIISQLSAAGIIRATRGARGGVALARGADSVNLLEVIEAIDGPVRLNECVTDPGVCSMNEICPVRSVWCKAQAELVERLQGTRFSQLTAPTTALTQLAV